MWSCEPQDVAGPQCEPQARRVCDRGPAVRGEPMNTAWLALRDGRIFRGQPHGAQDGILSSVARDPAELLARARALPGLVGRDLVAEVTAEPYGWSEGSFKLGHGYVAPPPPRFRVVAYDCGIKHNILRQLRMAGAHVTVVPAATPAEAVLETRPDGVFLSNGPGDPEAVPYLIESVRGLLGRLPVFGI